MQVSVSRVRAPVFFSLMAVGSAVTVAKLAILASILPPEDFAYYASAFAAATFAAFAFSLGLVESTPKRYTRWVARGRSDLLSVDLRSILRSLIWRSILLTSLACLFAIYVGGISSALTVAAVGMIGLAMTSFSLVGSILRSFDRLLMLAFANLSRTFLTAAVAITLVSIYGWQIGLVGEAILIAALAMVFLAILDVQCRSAERQTDSENIADTVDRGGIWLLGAYLVASIPVSLDRWGVTMMSAPSVAGQYAFLSIWLAAAYTLTSIYIQKFGPDIIRHRDMDPHHALLPRTVTHVLLIGLFAALASAISFLVLYFFLFETFWLKYSLTLPVVIAAIIAAALQISPLFDWTLIALDAEASVFAGSIVLVVFTAIGFAVAFSFGWGVTGYLGAVASGRLAQAAAQVLMVLIAQRRAPAR